MYYLFLTATGSHLDLVLFLQHLWESSPPAWTEILPECLRRLCHLLTWRTGATYRMTNQQYYPQLFRLPHQLFPIFEPVKMIMNLKIKTFFKFSFPKNEEKVTHLFYEHAFSPFDDDYASSQFVRISQRFTRSKRSGHTDYGTHLQIRFVAFNKWHILWNNKIPSQHLTPEMYFVALKIHLFIIGLVYTTLVIS